jgi:crossover junction endodeoxyribonuclease RuvC
MPNKPLGFARDKCTLAIDPGFDRIGVAILTKEKSKEKLLFSKCILTNKKESQAKRLKQIGLEIKKIIKKWNPESLAIEKLFFNQNTSTALRVAEARGVIFYEAVCAGLEIFEYSPQEIKIAVTGYGKATKKQVETMTLRLLTLKTHPKYDDEIDAQAIGITHLVSYKHKRLLSTD